MIHVQRIPVLRLALAALGVLACSAASAQKGAEKRRPPTAIIAKRKGAKSFEKRYPNWIHPLFW